MKNMISSIVMFGVVLSMGWIGRADEAGPGRAYTILSRTQIGMALLGQHPDAKSSQKVLQATVNELSDIFERGIKLTGEFSDKDDHSTVATFTARREGVAVKGLIFASVGSKGGTAALLFDAADAPAGNFSQLAAALPRSEVKWRNEQIPDGTGSLKLPSDWKITDYRGDGSVAAAGADGQSVVFGKMMMFITPEGDAAFRQMQLNAIPVAQGLNIPVLPYTDPVTACENVMAMINRQNMAASGAKITSKILESAPINGDGFQAATVHVLTTVDDGKSVTQSHGFANVTVMPMRDGQWMYYISCVAAPEGIYQRDLDSMLEIWNSWRVNADVSYERMRQAAKSMNEISKIITRSYECNQLVIDHAAADFDETIRGFRKVQDTQSDDHADLNLGNVDKIVEKLNEYAGYKRYIEVPLRDQ